MARRCADTAMGISRKIAGARAVSYAFRMNVLYQILFVLSMSRKLQWAIVIGIVGPPILLAIALWYIDKIQFSGVMAPLLEPLKHGLREHYVKEVVVLFIGNVIWWFKLYHREKRRIDRFF